LDFLIVDDHAGMRSLIQECVAPFAREIRMCASGEEALQILRDFPADCATVDFSMPGMDGVATIEALHARRPNMHLVLITQFLDSALRDRALAAGAAAVIDKDHLSDLITHLHEYGTRRAAGKST